MEDPDADAIARQLHAHHIPAEQANGIAEVFVQSTLAERSLMQAVIRSEIERAIAPLAESLAENTDRLTRLEAKVDINIARLDAKIETSFARLDEKIDASVARVNEKIDASVARLNEKIDASVARLDRRIDRVETKLLWIIGILLLQTGFLAGLSFTLLR